MAAEDRLYDDAALARFYDLDNGWTADRDFCLTLAKGCGSVLDLGCGTGALALRIAGETGASVVAVDPARAMLDLARAKPGAGAVRWVEADARRLHLGGRFELIVMTGHAFQVFLTDADRSACLACIARHLAPDGHFIFDMRNPARREWEEWHPALSRRRFDDPVLGAVDAWNDVSWDEAAEVVTYETVYEAPGGHVFRAASRIGFTDRTRLEALIRAAGLRVERWYGDWTGAECGNDSPEFIPYGRLA
ncbi:MAG TPA: methyltransferase domain-containing protein [Albidovulum sp.]|uniref:class I SAM-dependent methyltransferase n=1 Tax=Albidovulum sp. TaxID=1872424 RepID=UPI002C701376|nr:methyltransferase domain-containing protein [Albidovulum sp.]